MSDTAKILAILVLIISASCSRNQNDKKENKITGFCDNELDLLISLDSISNTDFNLFEIRDNTKEKIEHIYNEPYCNSLKFNVQYHKDLLINIPLTLNMLYLDDCDYPEFIPRLFCNVLINKNGQCLVESELYNIDSISNLIVDFYNSGVVKEYSPDDYKRVFIAVLWDKELEEKYFTKAISEILDGYFEFVDNISQTEYGKKLCDLSVTELITIKQQIPFNLRTDFYGGFEKIDFLPPDLPPVPVDNLEIELKKKY
ncbi:MAG: hypothetical protein PF694_05380 [Bacteroidetes bacterium]|nr:hypothetical protein [Bacteroidota bacterium]